MACVFWLFQSRECVANLCDVAWLITGWLIPRASRSVFFHLLHSLDEPKKNVLASLWCAGLCGRGGVRRYGRGFCNRFQSRWTELWTCCMIRMLLAIRGESLECKHNNINRLDIKATIFNMENKYGVGMYVKTNARGFYKGKTMWLNGVPTQRRCNFSKL